MHNSTSTIESLHMLLPVRYNLSGDRAHKFWSDSYADQFTAALFRLGIIGHFDHYDKHPSVKSAIEKRLLPWWVARQVQRELDKINGKK